MTLSMSEEDFERLVGEELDALPAEMTGELENVAFVVEDAPADGEDLLGRYEGHALTSRDRYGFLELPDRIVVYRRAHLRAARTAEDLRGEVRTTLVHEIGHYFGIDDDRLHELGWA